MEVPETRFASNRGARIAYQDFGQASPVVIAIPPTAQNVEEAWALPHIRSMLERLGSFARWINFDKRGSGASDRRSRAPGLDERVEDLRAVMDAAGVDRAFLYGASEGGPTCVMFAVTYPERVDGLILHGTGPYTSPRDLDASGRAHYDERARYMAEVWGTSDSKVAVTFAPSLAEDESFLRWHRRYERVSADSASLHELLMISLEVDVSEVLPLVDTPTLVMHRKGDPIIPVEWGRALANGIAEAEMIEAEGVDHFGYAGEREWLDHLERFVTGSLSDRPNHRAPRTIAIRTFGGFEVEVDGALVSSSEWGSRKARQLCKRLVASRGWPVRREELQDLLWPDESDPERLGSRLSVQLSHVRRVLGGGVVADRQTVALDLEVVASDLEVVLGHGADGDAERTDAEDQRIVDAYRGDFLPADVYEDWSSATRERARARFMAAALRLAEAAREQGDHLAVSSLVDRVLEADPYAELAHRLAYLSCQDRSDRAAALRVQDRWREAMEDLGLPASDLGRPDSI